MGLDPIVHATRMILRSIYNFLALFFCRQFVFLPSIFRGLTRGSSVAMCQLIGALLASATM